MQIKISGKESALAKLEKAKELIDEAGKLLWSLPSEMHVELSEDRENDSISDSAPDTQ